MEHAIDSSISSNSAARGSPPATLSIVIPAYNEASRIGPALRSLRGYAGRAGRAVETIVVDDGSRDATSQIVDAFDAGPMALKLIVSGRNRGKGHAVRTGMLAATGELRLFTDADLSAPIAELDKLTAWIAQGFDVVIGSRDMPDSVLDPPQPWGRRAGGKLLRWARRRIMLGDLSDTQCGFKLLTHPAAERIFARQRCDGFAFDCEVLAIARRLGYSICEVGITWRHHADSRVKPIRHGLGMLAALPVIRLRTSRLRPG